MLNADLSDDEIAHICKPLTQGAAQCRYLRSLGLTVHRRPDGSPLVNRAHYDAMMGSGTPVTATGLPPGVNFTRGVHAKTS